MLIPEIRVRKGMLVEPGTGTLSDPVPVMRSLESLLSTEEEDAIFFVIDEDGMKRNSFDMSLLERLGEEFRVWFKGGFRKADFLMDALILGAEVAVMDSYTVISLDELRKASEMSESVAFSIELVERTIWNGIPQEPEKIAGDINGLPLHSVIFSCDSEMPVNTSVFTMRKFSHGCGEQGFDGMIVPYTEIAALIPPQE